jgi:hypothetical protein
MTTTDTYQVANATRKEATMATTLTIGSAVICRDGVGSVVEGIVLDVMPGEARGGGLANVKAIWPGMKRASARFVELADVEVAA